MVEAHANKPAGAALTIPPTRDNRKEADGDKKSIGVVAAGH
jgi:hypothetical protein